MAVVAFVVLSACYEAGNAYIQRVSFQSLIALGGHPAKRTDAGWERVCSDGPVDGMLLDFVVASNPRSDGSTASIRPGDVIDLRVVEGNGRDDISLSRPGDIVADVECLAAQGTLECEPTDAAASEPARYVEHTPTRDTGHNVLLLLEQTASMSGAPSTLVSDPWDQRLVVANNLRASLGPNDRFGVLAFNELGLQVPCAANDLATCFGNDAEVWTAGIEGLRGAGAGRSNLWGAVAASVRLMQDALRDDVRSNHIIVINDGPDECRGESRGACSSACVTADYDALAAEMQRDAAGPHPIQVSFVQIAADASERDARQGEFACLSGGFHHLVQQHISPSAEDLRTKLQWSVAILRAGFMGHWQTAVALPKYDALPAGSHLLARGILTINPQTNLVQQSVKYELKSYGAEPGIVLRKPCVQSDCAATGACQIGCSSETRLCSDADLPDLAACGEGGFCCEGECRSSGTCESCPSP